MDLTWNPDYSATQQGAFSDMVTFEERPEEGEDGALQISWERPTRQRDQEVHRPSGWNVLGVAGESKSSVAEEERPMGRVLGNESEGASGPVMQGFRGPGQNRFKDYLDRLTNFSGMCLAHSRCSVYLLSSSALYDCVLLSFMFLELNLSPSVYIYTMHSVLVY